MLLPLTEGLMRTTHFDDECCQLADRHYSRRTVGARQFAYSGRKLVLRDTEGAVLWVWMFPDPAMRGAEMKMKTFPTLVHLAYEPNADGEEDYLCVFTNGVVDIEPGQRCAIYKRIDEGYVRGPKSYISKQPRR